jgi:hypothetical protein
VVSKFCGHFIKSNQEKWDRVARRTYGLDWWGKYVNDTGECEWSVMSEEGKARKGKERKDDDEVGVEMKVK